MGWRMVSAVLDLGSTSSVYLLTQTQNKKKKKKKKKKKNKRKEEKLGDKKVLTE